MGEIVSLVKGALQYVTTKTSAVDLIESNRQRFAEDMKRNEAAAKERAQREFAEIDNEIASLKSERDSLVNRRNGIASRFNESNGLFGDTKADENDLFGGENFLDENAAQREIDNINTQIRNIDAQIEKLESSKNRANEVTQGEIGGANGSDDFWNTTPTDEEVPFSIGDESTDDANTMFSIKKRRNIFNSDLTNDEKDAIRGFILTLSPEKMSIGKSAIMSNGYIYYFNHAPSMDSHLDNLTNGDGFEIIDKIDIEKLKIDSKNEINTRFDGNPNNVSGWNSLYYNGVDGGNGGSGSVRYRGKNVEDDGLDSGNNKNRNKSKLHGSDGQDTGNRSRNGQSLKENTTSGYISNQPKFSITSEQDAEYMEAVNSGDTKKAEEMVKEAAKAAMPNTKVVDENGEPMVVYHRTNSTEFVNKKTGQKYDDLDWQERDYWQDEATDEEWNDTWEERDFNVFNADKARRSVEVPGFFFAPEFFDEDGKYVGVGNVSSQPMFRIEEAYSDGQRLDIDVDTNGEGYRVEGLNGAYQNKDMLLDAFRDRHPEYFAELDGDAIVNNKGTVTFIKTVLVNSLHHSSFSPAFRQRMTAALNAA